MQVAKLRKDMEVQAATETPATQLDGTATTRGGMGDSTTPSALPAVQAKHGLIMSGKPTQRRNESDSTTSRSSACSGEGGGLRNAIIRSTRSSRFEAVTSLLSDPAGTGRSGPGLSRLLDVLLEPVQLLVDVEQFHDLPGDAVGDSLGEALITNRQRCGRARPSSGTVAGFVSVGHWRRLRSRPRRGSGRSPQH